MKARIIFSCPHCGQKLNRTVDTPIEIEGSSATVHVKCIDGICAYCGRGLHGVFCAGIVRMSEHEIRKDAELFRIAERIRSKRHLSID